MEEGTTSSDSKEKESKQPRRSALLDGIKQIAAAEHEKSPSGKRDVEALASISGEPQSFRKVINDLCEVVSRVPHTDGDTFWNQLFGGRNEAAIAGEFAAAITNNSMYTLKVGGEYVHIEREAIRKVAELIGYDEFEGSATPGGSLSNFLGLVLARDRLLESHPDSNISQLTFYYSSEAHYSIPKGLRLAGISREVFREIPANDEGQLSIVGLEKAIAKDKAEGYLPSAIIGTAGTTVLGSFDDLEELSRISRAHNIWFHVDAAYGGPILFSKKHKAVSAGIELADSVTWDAHKLMGVPLTASMLLTKHQGALKDSLSEKASYLFQMDPDCNPGVTSLQCGRRNDMLKVWAQWKHFGDNGFEERIDHLFALREYALQIVQDDDQLSLPVQSGFLNLCFEVDGIDSKMVCAAMNDEGIRVGWGVFKDKVFIRLIFVNPAFSREAVDSFFEALKSVVSRMT